MEVGILDSTNTEPELERARRILESDTEEAMDLRFETFMDELEVHADPAFGNGKMPEINRAAQRMVRNWLGSVTYNGQDSALHWPVISGGGPKARLCSKEGQI